jgi:hypothetical protein
MTITPSLFEAFLKCPSKCWLRATGETPSGNPYAEWVQSQNESYRTAQTKRLLAEIPPEAMATSPPPERLKASQWLLAVDVAARASAPASSSSVPLPGRTPDGTTGQPTEGMSALPNAVEGTESAPSQTPQGRGGNISPPMLLESHLHAVQRVPAAGRGKAAQFIPIRLIYRNKLTSEARPSVWMSSGQRRSPVQA